MYNIAFIGEDGDFRNRFAASLSKFDADGLFASEVGYFAAAEDFTAAAEKYRLVFLDADAAGGDWFAAALSLACAQQSCLLTLCSCDNDVALRGYGVNAFRVLFKPLSDESLAQCLRDACARESRRIDTLTAIWESRAAADKGAI